MDNKEKYVPFDIAERLKELKYDEECSYAYDLEFKELFKHFEDKWKNSEIENGYFKSKYPMISAPEVNDIVDMILKENNIHIYTYPVKPFDFDDIDYPKIVWISKICHLKQINFETYVNEEGNGLAINHHRTKYDAINAAIRFLLKK